jgi:Ran GTPase-activating protein (RanGAP) involved in mRNA processing and transport
MMDAGLGTESAKVIGDILRNSNQFSSIKLGKNAMGDSGSVILVRSILKNNNIVHLDLSSNDISPEGSRGILSMLITHPSLVSLDLSSHEGLHRNRIGVRGSEPLKELLTMNPMIAFLNIQGTSLSYEGVVTLSKGLAGNKVLISLNLSSNNLGPRCMEALINAVSQTNLQELFLASNKLGNDGCDYLAELISGSLDSPCPLKKLDISKNEIVGKGGQKLFNALRTNSSIKEVILNHNQIQLASVGFIGFITDNAYLEVLSMAGCEVRSEGAILFNEGLAKNKSLKSLNLSSNLIDDEGAEYIANGLSRNIMLKILDLSSNKIMVNFIIESRW